MRTNSIPIELVKRFSMERPLAGVRVWINRKRKTKADAMVILSIIVAIGALPIFNLTVKCFNDASLVRLNIYRKIPLSGSSKMGERLSSASHSVGADLSSSHHGFGSPFG
jgi:hypothetical protein